MQRTNRAPLQSKSVAELEMTATQHKLFSLCQTVPAKMLEAAGDRHNLYANCPIRCNLLLKEHLQKKKKGNNTTQRPFSKTAM